MSRAHCLDCEADVVVDPLGHCPEGHLLGAPDQRIAGAIADGDPHPDEPHPWVASVDVETAGQPAPRLRAVRPQAAPGLEQAAAPEPTHTDLFSELSSLHDDTSAHAAPAAAPAPPDVPPDPAAEPAEQVASARPAPEAPEAPASPAPPVTAHVEEQHDAVSELSALESAVLALQASSESPPRQPTTPTAAPDPGPTPTAAPDPGSTSAPAPAADVDPAVEPPPADRPHRGDVRREALADVASLAASPPDPTPPPPPAAAPAPPPPPTGGAEPPRSPGIDTMNFTAKGGSLSGGRRRRRLGR